MKVTIIYYQYPIYDKGSYLQEQVDAIAKLSKEVLLITTKFPKDAKFKKPKNLNIIWLPRVDFLFFYDLFFSILVFLYAIRSPKFIDSDIVNQISARGGLAALLLKKIYKKPTVCTIEIINNPATSFKDALFFKFQKYIFTRRGFDKIICWSKYYYGKYLKKWGIEERQISYITCGVDLELFDYRKSGEKIRKQYRINKNEKLFVFAKPMYEYNRKSAELLLDSLVLIKNIKYKVLIGSGEQKKILQKKIEELGMREKVVFMKPDVPLREIPFYLAAADCIVLSFTYPATTARSFLEALAMRKPTIVTKSGEIPNIVKNNDHVLLVDKDKNKIKNAIVRVINDKKLSNKISKNGFELIKNKYAIDSIAKQTMKFYKEVNESIK